MRRSALLLAAHRYAEAASLLEGEIHSVRRGRDKSELIRTLLELGVSYYESKRLDEARAALAEALEISRVENEPRAIRAALHELSMVLSAQGEHDEAIALCKESVQLHLRDGDEPSVELHTLSVLYQEANRLDEAMETLEMVRESCEARQDLQALGMCLNEIGLIHSQMGDVATAARFLVDSIEYKRRIDNRRGIEFSLNNLDACLKSHPLALADPEVRRQLDRLKSILT
jgi:tetratricopeptide (TPR) repeat protein